MILKKLTPAFLIALFVMMLPVVSNAQLSKSQVPKQTLVEVKNNSPRELEFSGDKLIVRTASEKSTGKQYMVQYKVTWKGNKFDLTSLKEVATEINVAGEEVTTTAKNSDFFGYSYLKNWTLTKDDSGNYTLSSEATSDYKWVFKTK